MEKVPETLLATANDARTCNPSEQTLAPASCARGIAEPGPAGTPASAKVTGANPSRAQAAVENEPCSHDPESPSHEGHFDPLAEERTLWRAMDHFVAAHPAIAGIWAALCTSARPKVPNDEPVATAKTSAHARQIAHVLEARGVLPSGYSVLAQVTRRQVRGLHVCGAVPLHIAAAAALVTEAPLLVPNKLRGARSRGELTPAELQEYAQPTEHYVVRRVGGVPLDDDERNEESSLMRRRHVWR